MGSISENEESEDPHESVFTTRHLPDHLSVKRWHEYLTEAYCHQDVLLEIERASGAIRRTIVDDVVATQYEAGGAQSIHRRREHIKHDKIEQFHFVFPTQGIFSYRQNHVERCVLQQQAYMVNSADPFSVRVSDDAAMRCVALPCDLLRECIPGIDDFCSRGTLADPLLINTLSEFVGGLVSIETESLSAHRQNICVELLAISIADMRRHLEGWKSSEGLRDLQHDEIHRLMRQNYSNPMLSLSDVAALAGISKRQVQKVLGQRNEAFGTELMKIRLNSAAALLKTKSRLIASVGTIAAQCGFSSQSYFSTCYRKYFGVSPSDDR